MVPICVTNDKDNKQTIGEHYDPVKKEAFYVTQEEADRWFYYQLLVGDTVDNLKGVVGIGKKKAAKLLQQAEEQYQEYLEIGGEPNSLNSFYHATVEDLYSCEEEFEQAAKCTWIWRKRGDIWQRNNI
jgi:5'-3' exonuclease